MEQNPSWQNDGRLACQEFTHLLWNQIVHYSIHKSRPLDILRATSFYCHPAGCYATKPSYITHRLVIYSAYNNTTPFTPRSPTWDLPAGISTKFYINSDLSHVFCVSCPLKYIKLTYSNNLSKNHIDAQYPCFTIRLLHLLHPSTYFEQ
jgi:hypothetical protein